MILTLDGYHTIQHFTGMSPRVMVNSEDVTDRCFSVDYTQGWAACFRLRDGKPYLENHRVAAELLCGEVMIVRGASGD